jgi:hypothetical protein
LNVGLAFRLVGGRRVCSLVNSAVGTEDRISTAFVRAIFRRQFVNFHRSISTVSVAGEAPP